MASAPTPLCMWAMPFGSSCLPATQSTLPRNRHRSSSSKAHGRGGQGSICGLLGYRRVLCVADSGSRPYLALSRSRSRFVVNRRQLSPVCVGGNRLLALEDDLREDCAPCCTKHIPPRLIVSFSLRHTHGPAVGESHESHSYRNSHHRCDAHWRASAGRRFRQSVDDEQASVDRTNGRLHEEANVRQQFDLIQCSDESV